MWCNEHLKIIASLLNKFKPDKVWCNEHSKIRLASYLPIMGNTDAYVGACTIDPNPHPELIWLAQGW